MNAHQPNAHKLNDHQFLIAFVFDRCTADNNPLPALTRARLVFRSFRDLRRRNRNEDAKSLGLIPAQGRRADPRIRL